MDNDSLFDFFEEEEELDNTEESTFKIMIVDDDEQVHIITQLMLKSFDYDNHKLEFVSAYSGKEAKELLKDHPDVAVVFLDVVMESSTAGLDVVKYLREELKYEMTRIILRTGQPGEAPEAQIIRDYDINDYRLKTDMTIERLFTSLYVALRSYNYILRIENNRVGLEKIINASSNLFKHNSMEDFFKTILEQLSTFYENPTALVYIKEKKHQSHGFITMDQKDATEIVAGTGKFEQYVGQTLSRIDRLKDVHNWIMSHQSLLQQVQVINNGILIKKSGANTVNNYIYIEGEDFKFDLDLINVFMANYSIALDNYILNDMVRNGQSEIIITFTDTLEKQFLNKERHIERISDAMYRFALLNNFSYSESELIKIASMMHDVGKIGIADEILKKPDSLNDEEFKLVKMHTIIGHDILEKSELRLMKVASEMALYHHERYDGTGYPEGLFGKNIPINARMMAIVDVFDTMTHNRVYKGAESISSAIEYLKNNKGKHFDPGLVDIFISNLDQIIGMVK